MDGPVSRVRVDPRAAVRVAFDPYTSVLALACAGVRDRLRGLDTVPARVAARIPRHGVQAFARLVAPGRSVGPECVTPAEPAADTDVPAEVDRLRGLTDAEVHDDLDRTFGGSPPPHWLAVADAPARWARDVADGLEALWQGVEPVWRRESELRVREAERVGAAAARGALDVVLASAHPRGRAEDGALVFPDPEGTDLDAVGRLVVLTPVLNRLDVSISNLERAGLVWLAYPVPGTPGPAPHPGGLDALLTPVRAQLLRALDGERSMSRVAEGSAIAPSVATHHVHALVAAGLARRRREGRHTLVSRTGRGAALLELYDAAARTPRGNH
ncbi:winged helix-turn-helix domain-containing protein [Pseudonocardia kunmingensis]|uniref:Helix-turn-helix protein n=1 Tax=Pseudonocardia kunmingensis TaxID=630975 RepID=A0A543DWR6_9PSEU|nr:winged helix-turn-helix domain-containing protein [Pseudonocardia kunmingensis]TQM13773.1 helix-turn-helix protein [Pseudonocardia kunmingensis]